MTCFKSKNIKYHNIFNHLNSTSLIIHGTLDQKNKEMLSYIEKKKNDLPKLITKLNKLKTEYNKLNKKLPKLYTIDDINNKAEIQDKIVELEEQISQINNNDDEIDYFSKTYSILNDYYDNNIQDNKQPNNIKNLNDFFTEQKKNKLIVNKTDENSYLDKWMKIVHNKSIRRNYKNYGIKICNTCNVEKILHSSDGYIICPLCGKCEYIILDTEKINYKDQFIETKNIGYKRMNHFSELMNQFQAKESTDISADIFNLIINELKKQRINNKNISNKLMRSILKKLELNNYFEHIPFIINKITGLPPPNVCRDIEEKLKQMFRDIQDPFELYRPKRRKNFLNYNYVYHKFFELLDMDQFLPHFPLVKSAEKLREHDEIWQKICKHLKWQYIPSN